MALPSGTQLGPFVIQSALGAGGMGEVYRARDTRLAREVAIKVLPEFFASDSDRLRRFEQEARAVAALNHPNVLAVHDIGVQDGVRYIVTELLEGRTLREQLNDGPLPVRKALDYARQISDGLAAAHSRGIVHRDLKPENLFCTKDGRVKILDFGLAKDLSQAPLADATMTGATIPDVHTEPGLVMGTVGYMSPEQVRGAAADHRSDLFSLGAILYEMLSGKRAFKRDTTAETMTAILKEDPADLDRTSSAISPGIERIVHRCLEKEPAQRFQSAADLGFALESLSGATNSVAPPPDTARAPKWGWAAAAAGLVIAASLAGWFARGAMTPPRRNPTFHQVSYRRGTVYSARLSADGKTVVYTAAWEGKPAQTFLASYEFPESRPIEIKQGVLLSVSSAGDLAILTGIRPLDHFEFRGTLATLPIGGGAPREILQDVTAADWAPDGKSLAIVHLVSGKYRLEYPIGKTLFETTGSITQPRVSRDASMVAFLFHPTVGDDRGGVMVVDGSAKARFVSNGWEAEQGLAWTSSGEIWFSAAKTGSDLTLHAATTSGDTRDVFAGPGGTRIFDIASDGRLLVSHMDSKYAVAASISGGEERDLSWLDNSFSPALANDGKRILFSDGGEQANGLYTVCLRNTDGSPVIRLGDGAVFGFSPDGAWALALLEKSPPEIELLPTGPGEARRWVNSNIENYSGMGWTPDSQRIIFAGNEPGHGSRFFMQDATGGAIRPLTAEGFTSRLFLPVSPDGKQFTAFDDHSNAWSVCQVEDGKCAPLRGSEPDDVALQWSADGKFIYVGVQYPESSFWRIELASGHRQLWKRVVPTDPVGAFAVYPVGITPDGKSSVTQYVRSLDQLYLVEGVN